MYLHELKIGNVKLKNNIILAPMAGVTDLPFRIIAEKFTFWHASMLWLFDKFFL